MGPDRWPPPSCTGPGPLEKRRLEKVTARWPPLKPTSGLSMRLSDALRLSRYEPAPYPLSLVPCQLLCREHLCSWSLCDGGTCPLKGLSWPGPTAFHFTTLRFASLSGDHGGRHAPSVPVQYLCYPRPDRRMDNLTQLATGACCLLLAPPPAPSPQQGSHLRLVLVAADADLELACA